MKNKTYISIAPLITTTLGGMAFTGLKTGLMTGGSGGGGGGGGGGGDDGILGGGTDAGTTAPTEAMTGTPTNTIQSISFSTDGNSSDFGDLLHNSNYPAAADNGSSDRCDFVGGTNSGQPINNIQYVTMSSAGNATDAGDLLVAKFSGAGLSNASNDRGVTLGHFDAPYGMPNGTIEYWTISTGSNASDFGDTNESEAMYVGACSNAESERGVYAIGNTMSGSVDTIEYITINSAGNATDFGDVSVERAGTGGLSNGTNNRGVFIGGFGTAVSNSEVMDYITINSTGNATDFGDLNVSNGSMYVGALSSGTGEKGIIAGGNDGANNYEQNYIHKITINSTGNSTDIGDLVAYGISPATGSNAST